MINMTKFFFFWGPPVDECSFQWPMQLWFVNLHFEMILLATLAEIILHKKMQMQKHA